MRSLCIGMGVSGSVQGATLIHQCAILKDLLKDGDLPIFLCWCCAALCFFDCLFVCISSFMVADGLFPHNLKL